MIKPEMVTIVIPHLGGTPESEYALDQCIKSLIETVPDIKKMVVFNDWKSSCQHTPQPGDITLTEQGQCKAVNAAVATVNTPWIFVTNDDMVYAPGWWERLAGPLGKSWEAADGVSHKPFPAKILCISPQLVEPRKGAPTFIEYFCGGAGGDFDKQKFLDFVQARRDYDWPLTLGFNLPFLISKELWDTVGGYDINYDPWGSNSDSDLEYKIKLAGMQPVQSTDCLVYHFSQTSGTFNPENQSHWQKNWDYFIEKWGFPRTDEGIWEATFEIPDEGRKYRPDYEGKYAKS